MNRIMIMRPILFFILGAIGILLISLLGETLMAQAREQAAKKEAINSKKYDPSTLFKFTLDAHPEQTKLKAMEEYKKCPPLRPERFSRRIKMLWGIDINKYPDNALLWFGEDYKLSLKYQTIQGFMDYSYLDKSNCKDAECDGPDYMPAPLPATMYLPLREYLLYNDDKSYNLLDVYCKDIINKDPKDNTPAKGKNACVSKTELYWLNAPPYILGNIYYFVYFSVPSLVNKNYGDGRILVPAYKMEGNDGIGNDGRITDLRNDMLTLYIMGELKQGRQLANNDIERNKQQYIQLTFPTSENKSYRLYPEVRDLIGRLEPRGKSFINEVFDSEENSSTMWENYGDESYGRSTASALSQLLQLKGKSFDKAVLLFLSGQIKEYDSKNMVANIKKNNYFGYTLLREYDNNLMREMPTLAKIGTSFQGHVKQANTLLYLEPFKESYSIDTLQTYEAFTAYEMGHDDYYFVEVEKPVESPIAGTDGYAKIVDRTEIVHGYIEKSKVVPYTDAQLLTHPHFTDHTSSKKGVINDKDGYVNVRAERNTKSEVVDKLVGIEFVEYWQLMGNWYIVETRNGKRGFVYKDRIKENK